MEIDIRKLFKLSILVLVCGGSQTGIAQDVTATVIETSASEFNLFETVDTTNNSASAAEAARNNRGQGSRNTQAAPTFTLVGTTRIGDRHTALLKHMSGESVKVPLLQEINPVPGHELYTVLQYGAGQLALRYPAAIPCGDFPDQGVSCNSTTNIATLSLTTAEAIVSAEPASLVEESGDEAAVEEETVAADAPRNPFAALRDRNRQNDGNRGNPAGQFQPRRIAPEEVPPGYRVVSTPFGDRLVEQN